MAQSSIGAARLAAAAGALVCALAATALLAGRAEERRETGQLVTQRAAEDVVGSRSGEALAGVRDSASRDRASRDRASRAGAAPIAPRGPAHAEEPSAAAGVRTANEAEAVPAPLRELLIAADVPDGVSIADLQLHVWLWLGRSVARPSVPVPVRAEGGALAAAIPDRLRRKGLSVELRTRDALWASGMVRIGGLQPRERVLALRLEPVGSVEVVVERQDEPRKDRSPGAPVEGDWVRIPSVRLEGVQQRIEWTTYGGRRCRVERRHDALHGSLHAGPTTTHSFVRLPLGPVTIRTTQRRARADVRTVEVVHGHTEVVVDLEPLPSAGSIEGNVTVLSEGTGSLFGGVVAQHVDREEVRFLAPIRSTTGDWKYRFDDLPEGTYRIAPFPESAVDVTPRERRAAPPAVGIDFSMDRRTPRIGLAFEVVDASTKELLPTVTVSFDQPLGAVRSKRTRGTGIVHRVPEGTDVRWRMTCEGYRPVQGDRDAFARHESRPHRHNPDERVDVWIADIELVRDR